VVLLKDREVEARALQPAERAEDLGAQAAAAEILMWRDRLITELQRGWRDGARRAAHAAHGSAS
jgi:hypothetical protein